MLISRREPIRAIGIAAARKVREEIGYGHPTAIEIEILAFMRGALVRPCPAKGARANLMRLGDRGVIGVSDGLSLEERRWAIAHELGHFEAHPDVSFESLCSSTDMLPSYRASGREPEANAFAAELLMPEDLFAPKCEEVGEIEWGSIESLAYEFTVSPMAAAIRFVAHTKEPVAVVCTKDGVIEWASASPSFGRPRPRRGRTVDASTAAHAFFKSDGTAPPRRTSIHTNAWLDDPNDNEEGGVLEEEVLPIPLATTKHRIAMSLLRLKP